MRATKVFAVLATAAVLALSGCGGSSSAGTASAASNGVSDLTADQILEKATAAAKDQSSVHVVGKGTSNGDAFGLDMRLRKGGGGVGSVTLGTDTVQIVTTGSDIYLKASKEYWARTGTAAAAALIGDRWVKAPTSNASFAQLAQLGDFGTSLDTYLKPDGTITKGDQSSVQGQPAIALVSGKGKLWVATTGQPLPIQIDSGTAGENLTFSDWGATVDVAVPADADTLNIADLQGKLSTAAAGNAIARPPAGDVALLAVAVVAVSTSGPIIAACAAPALAIAFWRCALGSGATGPFVWWRHRGEIGALARRELALMGTAGLLLAAHFATWIPSLRFTSVASSTALVATQPVWAAIIARWRGATVAPRVWVGIAIALAGVLVLTGIDVAIDPRALVGDLLALAGGILAAAYVTAGSEVRQQVSTASYTFVAYGVAGIALLAVCLVGRVPLGGWSARDWWLIVALTVIAQLLGHTVIARVLSTTSATVVSLAILFEMPGATLIAAVWLGQTPPLAIIPAVVMLFVGIAVVISASDRDVLVEEPPV